MTELKDQTQVKYDLNKANEYYFVNFVVLVTPRNHAGEAKDVVWRKLSADDLVKIIKHYELGIEQIERVKSLKSLSYLFRETILSYIYLVRTQHADKEKYYIDLAIALTEKWKINFSDDPGKSE